MLRVTDLRGTTPTTSELRRLLPRGGMDVNAVLPAVFTVAMCVLVALGALTAREGYKKSLAELDA